MSYKETGKCSINPKHTYTHWGNNAEPVNSGRCCDSCNNRVVIPCRFYGAQMSATMSQLGSRSGGAKAGAARENGKKGGRPKKLST